MEPGTNAAGLIVEPVRSVAEEMWRSSPERQRHLRTTTAVVAVGLLLVLGVGLYAYFGRADSHDELARREAELVDARTAVAVASDAEAAAQESERQAEVAVGDVAHKITISLAGENELEVAREALQSARGDLQTEHDRVAAAEGSHSEALKQRNDALSSSKAADRNFTVALLICALVAILAVVGIAFSRTNRQIEMSNRRAVEEIAKKSRALDNEGNPLSLRALWSLNRAQLSNYHTLVLNFARTSRDLTTRALVVGFGFTFVVGLAAIATERTSSSIAGGLVAASTAALTGFVTSAVLRNAESSSKELLAFFKHPIEIDRMLSAERLAAELPDDSQVVARLKIIDALGRAAESASPV